DFVQHLERDLYVVLLISAERAAYGIEQKALGLINRLLREVRVIESGGPAGHFGGDGLFEGCGSGGQSVFSGQSLVLGRWSLVVGPWSLVLGRRSWLSVLVVRPCRWSDGRPRPSALLHIHLSAPYRFLTFFGFLN